MIRLPIKTWNAPVSIADGLQPCIGRDVPRKVKNACSLPWLPA
jgi:hypothetical protein